MLPEVKFFSSNNVFLTGIGLKRAGGDWQYYLPFKSGRPGNASLYPDGDYPRSQVHFVLPLSEARVVAASPGGELALIDLVADKIVARAKITCTPAYLQLSAGARYLFLQDSYSLYVLEATTLALVQHWHEIERTEEGWARYTKSESQDVRLEKIENVTLERLNLYDPVREVDYGKLTAPFCKSGFDAYGPAKRSGTYVFDIATGAIERLQDAVFRDRPRPSPVGEFRSVLSAIGPDVVDHLQKTVLRDLPQKDQIGKFISGMLNIVGGPHPPKNERSSGPAFALTCPGTAPRGPAGFEALVTREAMVNLAVADDSREAAIVVLDDLAERMERDIDALYCCEAINVHVVCDGKTIETKAFFDRFVRENWVEAAPALRRLMLAYLNNIDGGEGCMPWHYSGQAEQALRALVLLDPDAHDAYRLYLDKGDLEHDHSPYMLYADYLQRHGVRNEADVRFGIYLTIMGCLDTETDPTALLEGAEQRVTAERLAEIVIEEANHRSDDFWAHWGKDYVEYLGRPDTAFTRKVIDILRSRL